MFFTNLLQAAPEDLLTKKTITDDHIHVEQGNERNKVR